MRITDVQALDVERGVLWIRTIRAWYELRAAPPSYSKTFEEALRFGHLFEAVRSCGFSTRQNRPTEDDENLERHVLDYAVPASTPSHRKIVPSTFTKAELDFHLPRIVKELKEKDIHTKQLQDALKPVL